MSDFIKPEDWFNARERFSAPKRLEPSIDEPVSKIVGKKIYSLDPRLMKLIVKWKKSKPPDSMEFDNFFENPKFITELKQALSGNL